MNRVVRAYPKEDLRVILDNSSSHRTPEALAWLRENRRVQFHYTPTSASWLNQVEGFFGILGKQSLGVTNFASKQALKEHLNAYMRSWNNRPTPFAWTKPAISEIIDGVEKGPFKPVAHRIFPLTEIVRSPSILEASDQVGKIVMVPDAFRAVDIPLDGGKGG
jgi:NADPH:quinone reductase-like Zn-dependent oxidoreductase